MPLRDPVAELQLTSEGRPMKIHRWQPTGHTLCGLPLGASIKTTGPQVGDSGVTCLNCKKTGSRLDVLGAGCRDASSPPH